MNQILKKNIYDKDVQNILFQLREKIALIIGYLNNTMLRNEILYFSYLGTYIERFDNTARILDVRHFLFLPNTMIRNDIIGETQWEAILRSLSAYRAYMWQNQNELNAINISNFLILDDKMPRSLKFSLDQILKNIKLCMSPNFEDYYLKCQALKKVKNAHCLEKNLLKYRIKENSLSKNKLRIYNSEVT